MSDHPKFYHDMGRPDVEKLARAICVEYGSHPDQLTPETGYSDAVAIPLWWKYQTDAVKFIAMMKAVGEKS